MSQRARSLADTFERLNEGLITFAGMLSDQQWRALCPPEGRTFGVVLYHIAEGHHLCTEVARAVATGGALPTGLVRSKEEADRKNEQQALVQANCGRDQVVDLLKRHGAAATEFVRGLTDEQLDGTALVWGREGSVEQLIQHVLIAHLESHFAALRTTIDAKG